MENDHDKRRAELRQAYEAEYIGADTYHAAIAALDAQIQASASGSSAVAQKDSVAATTGGVAVGRDVLGNVYVGQPPANDAEALAIYRRVLAHTCGYLPLRGVDLEAANAGAVQEPLGLSNVYVDLNTTTQVEREDKKQGEHAQPGQGETRPLSALEAAVANRRLALLGDPGGGKTTFVQHLAHCLAAGQTGRLSGWPPDEKDALPILVVLRDLAAALPSPLPSQAEPEHLWAFISARLQAQKLEFAAKPLTQALEGGRAALFLDGLDEVPTRAQRVFVRDAVTVFARRYPQIRVLATCRVLSYQPPAAPGEPDLRLAGFPSFELAPFDEERINRFVGAWYEELARGGVVRSQDVAGLTRQLREAVRRPDLWRLASNPLLLTVMALVHAHKGRLPDARALLYEETVDILLWRWEQIKAGGQAEAPRLRQLLLQAGRTDVDLKRVLAQLAYQAHAQGDRDRDRDGEGVADIGQWELQKALAALKGDDHDWARQVIETIKLRAGLLLERAPEVFTFPHRTFQEYLAGAHLAAQGDFARQACELAGQGAAWREVILLAVGRLVYRLEDHAKPLALAAELCPARADDDEAAWLRAWLAGDALLEVGLNRVGDSNLGQDLLARLRLRLALLLAQGRLAPRQRAAAGDTLARLGDPRPGVLALADAAFCPVPPGPFWMGSPNEDEMASSDEKPQRQVDVTYTYWMARYPVTVAQYEEFVQAGGYSEQRYWAEAQAAGVWRADGGVKGWRDDEPRGRPYDSGTPFNLPNHPVVGVTWYEALAFTRWLSEHWRKEDLLPAPWQVRLPSETEWEKAARGGVEIPVRTTPGRGWVEQVRLPLQSNARPKRRYPWGDEPDLNRANYNMEIGSTSAVGCFPGGASPYGVLDMSGNVLEWCMTRWQDSYKDYKNDNDPEGISGRVLRGGAFYYVQGDVRCAYRFDVVPDGRNDYVGFRVVVAPG